MRHAIGSDIEITVECRGQHSIKVGATPHGTTDQTPAP
jgi:hypothetical protein